MNHFVTVFLALFSVLAICARAAPAEPVEPAKPVDQWDFTITTYGDAKDWKTPCDTALIQFNRNGGSTFYVYSLGSWCGKADEDKMQYGAIYGHDSTCDPKSPKEGHCHTCVNMGDTVCTNPLESFSYSLWRLDDTTVFFNFSINGVMKQKALNIAQGDPKKEFKFTFDF